MGEFYQLSADEVFRSFGVKEGGLSPEDVEKQRKIHGRNELPKEDGFRILGFFIQQLKSPLVYILLIAGGLAFWIGEFLDTVIIFAAVAVNIGIGFYQEYSSSQILKRLQEKVRVAAFVRRYGEIHQIDASELVPGDIISVKTGMKIPADARLFKAKDLKTNEALLTGESSPVDKNIEKISKDAVVAERKNMIFMGSSVERGEGEAVVVKTGKDTEIGEIAILTSGSKEEFTPLQEKIASLGKFLSLIVVAAAAVIVIVGYLEEFDFYQIFVTAVAVAVAAIPEGLPAAIAVVLAVASKNIFKNDGLVKKLLAAETLGSVSTLLTDKTGTLTEGKMKVEKIISVKSEEDVLTVAALANEAILEKVGNKLVVRGEATDAAKLEIFLEKGFDLGKILEAFPRVNLLPFDSTLKFMASFHRARDGQGEVTRVFVSGAPEIILELSLDFPEKQKMREEFENFAERGFRLIAAAEAILPKNPDEISEKSEEELSGFVKNLTFLGLVAIRDPIREDVKETVKEVRGAGIKIIMFTGDHRLTAVTIGAELGFKTGKENIMEGSEIDKLSDEELFGKISQVEIFARVDPKHKMRITKAWKDSGEAVAVTGDGINDAPALKYADIGIALNSGTDVTKEASDLVLVEDSLSTIASAIKFGRTAFENIRKVTIFLLSGSFSEIILILGALVLRVPLPLTAGQILWTNLIEDGLPNFALAFEKGEGEIMKRKPLKRGEPILNKEAKTLAFTFGIVTDIVLLGLFFIFLKFSDFSLEYIRTFIFAALGTDSLMYVFSLKSLNKSIFQTNLWDNRYLLMAVLFGFFMTGLAIYLPILNAALKTVPLELAHVVFIFVIGFFKIGLVELIKWFYNREARL